MKPAPIILGAWALGMLVIIGAAKAQEQPQAIIILACPQESDPADCSPRHFDHYVTGRAVERCTAAGMLNLLRTGPQPGLDHMHRAFCATERLWRVMELDAERSKA
jgi:hypothetical protein